MNPNGVEKLARVAKEANDLPALQWNREPQAWLHPEWAELSPVGLKFQGPDDVRAAIIRIWVACYCVYDFFWIVEGNLQNIAKLGSVMKIDSSYAFYMELGKFYPP